MENKTGYTKKMDTLAKKAAARMERLAKKAEVCYGDVPVYYGGHKPESIYKEPSIVEQLNSAKTPEEVEAVLKKGLTFESVSPKTVKKWKKTANMVAKKLAEQS